MSLASGQSLSHYQILGPLGAGGMGEVYRARDTRLGREVAIKVLPEELAHDEERLLRFEREARTLASLNHPNVAGIYGVDQVENVCFLALELVPGEDLSTRIKRGALPVDETLDVCRQIAEGLEAAHEAGVVHRDLKPANVSVTPDGVVKILDFGLAKPIRSKAMDEGTSTAESDSFLMTEEGMVLGTPTYMSPEQARGKPVDRRTDIWAFGCVLYECLTGVRPFQGGSVADVMASIVGEEPDWSRLPRLPARAVELLRRALTKDPRLRLRDAGEARVQLVLATDELKTGEPVANPAAATPRRGPWAALLGILGLLAGIGIGFLLQREPATEPAVETAPAAAPRRLKFAVEDIGPEQGPSPNVTLSPDGTQLAWVQIDGIRIRSLDALTSRLISIGEGRSESGLPDRDEMPRALTWSPDSQELAYTLEEEFWRVSREGGPATLIARHRSAPAGYQSLCWSEDGQLVYLYEKERAVMAISTLGGEPVTLLTADPETTQHFDGISLLPDGSLLTIRHPHDVLPNTLALFRGGELRDLLQLPGWGLRNPRYGTGRLVFERRSEEKSSLWSVPFSVESGEVLGKPTLLVDQGNAPTIASDGTLAYVLQEGLSHAQPVWVDLEGRVESFGRRLEAEYIWSAASHDQRRVIFSLPMGKTVWAFDLQRGVSTQILQHELGAGMAGTLPDGRLYLSSWVKQGTYAFPPGGRGEPELFTEGMVTSITEDGRYALVQKLEQGDEGEFDLTVLDLEQGGEPRHFRTTTQGGGGTDISADGRWALYGSDKTGQDQIYLTRFPSGEGDWPVSTDGALFAWFDATAASIYLVRGGLAFARSIEVWKVTFQSQPEVQLGVPEKLFDLEGIDVMLTDFHTGEGRFVGFRRLDPSRRQVVVEMGWAAEG